MPNGSTLAHRVCFLKSYLRSPTTVGAVSPSSRALAAALCSPYAHSKTPATVLEVGAGTGAITRYLGSIRRDGDELDICEMDPDLANILERDVLTNRDFAPAVEAGKVRLWRKPVQELNHEQRYDFIISGLPLNAFEVSLVREVFDAYRRFLKPGGVLSYFEYMALRRTSRSLALGKRRTRIRTVSAFLTENIRQHQFRRDFVVQNLPPAHARHLRFDP